MTKPCSRNVWNCQNKLLFKPYYNYHLCKNEFASFIFQHIFDYLLSFGSGELSSDLDLDINAPMTKNFFSPVKRLSTDTSKNTDPNMDFVIHEPGKIKNKL